MSQVKIGDEVGTDTVSGIVYLIVNNLVHFVDEHGITYKMRGVQKTSYYSDSEKAQIVAQYIYPQAE